jgi:hypothetical protein
MSERSTPKGRNPRSRAPDAAGAEGMQLRLLPGGERRPDWSLDERTRRVGRRGVAAAREALRRAGPPEPRHPTPERRAS